jgi:hypothetical protein
VNEYAGSTVRIFFLEKLQNFLVKLPVVRKYKGFNLNNCQSGYESSCSLKKFRTIILFSENVPISIVLIVSSVLCFCDF